MNDEKAQNLMADVLIITLAGVWLRGMFRRSYAR